MDTARDERGAAIREQMSAAGECLVRGMSEHADWHSGVAEGYHFAATYDEHPDRTVWAEQRLRAAWRGAGSVTATTADEAIESYVGDGSQRRFAARAAGILRGFYLGTADRADAVECSNCGTRVLVDEPFDGVVVCETGEHGVTCSSDCRDASGCGRRCLP